MERAEETQPEVADLILLLGSSERLRVLATLEKEDLKLSEIAKQLDVAATEMFRQLHRLTEAQLIEKGADGRYRLTAYGRLVLSWTSPLEFVARHSGFFLDHDAFLIPLEFRARLQELSKTTYLAETIETLNKTSEIIQGARHHIDSVIVGNVAIIEQMRQRSEAGVKFRWLMHESFRSKAPSTLRAWSHRPEIRTASAVPGHIIYSERAALVTIRKLDGSMSYDSFSGDDPRFLSWARDLFVHEWDKASPWSF